MASSYLGLVGLPSRGFLPHRLDLDLHQAYQPFGSQAQQVLQADRRSCKDLVLASCLGRQPSGLDFHPFAVADTLEGLAALEVDHAVVQMDRSLVSAVGVYGQVAMNPCVAGPAAKQEVRIAIHVMNESAKKRSRDRRMWRMTE